MVPKFCIFRSLINFFKDSKVMLNYLKFLYWFLVKVFENMNSIKYGQTFVQCLPLDCLRKVVVVQRSLMRSKFLIGSHKRLVVVVRWPFFGTGSHRMYLRINREILDISYIRLKRGSKIWSWETWFFPLFVCFKALQTIDSYGNACITQQFFHEIQNTDMTENIDCVTN